MNDQDLFSHHLRSFLEWLGGATLLVGCGLLAFWVVSHLKWVW